MGVADAKKKINTFLHVSNVFLHCAQVKHFPTSSLNKILWLIEQASPKMCVTCRPNVLGFSDAVYTKARADTL